jgi:hypothetical protein
MEDNTTIEVISFEDLMDWLEAERVELFELNCIKESDEASFIAGHVQRMKRYKLEVSNK